MTYYTENAGGYPFGLPNPEDLIVLDIEASSLNGAIEYIAAQGPQSYPVEIGVVDHQCHDISYLIKRADGWVDWHGQEGDETKGYIHGISLDELEKDGKDVEFAAAFLNDFCKDKVVLCRGPNGAYSDRFWLGRLYEAAGIEQEFEVNCFADFIDFENDVDVDEAYEQSGFGSDAKHRAGDDALQWMRFYLNLYKIKEQEHQSKPEIDLSPSF
ncbi:MAG: hypothetical protein ACRBDI_10405 [Alphaproteobacteria bacterium]